jgi:hypothetical protein
MEGTKVQTKYMIGFFNLNSLINTLTLEFAHKGVVPSSSDRIRKVAGLALFIANAIQ